MSISSNSNNRTMSTEEIKRGLENIKRAQLQVLKQLRGDSYIASPAKVVPSEGKGGNSQGKGVSSPTNSNVRYRNSENGSRIEEMNNGNNNSNENVAGFSNQVYKSRVSTVKEENSRVSNSTVKDNQSRVSSTVKQDKSRVVGWLKEDNQYSIKQNNNNQLLSTLSPIKPITNNYHSSSSSATIQKQQQNQNTQSQGQSQSQTNRKSSQSLVETRGSTINESHENYQKLRRQFSAQRQQLKRKLTEITSKLNDIQNQRDLNKLKTKQNHSQLEEVQKLQSKVSELQYDKRQLQLSLGSCKQQIQDLIKTQKKLRAELQLKSKEKTILQTQIKSFKSQTIKQSRSINQLQLQITKHIHTINLMKQQQTKLHQSFQSKINMDVVINQVKSISLTHDYLFNKLKESTNIDLTVVEKESEIQNCFSRLLDYIQGVSVGQYSINHYNNNHNHEEDDYAYSRNGNNGNGSNNSYKNRKQSASQSKDIFKRSLVSESRVEEQQELEYLVREIEGGEITKKQAIELRQQNQTLRKKLHSLIVQRNSSTQGQSQGQGQNTNGLKLTTPQNNQPNSQYQMQAKRLINLELQQMKQQVARFKKFKLQSQQTQQQLQTENVKHKLKVKDLQTKLQTAQSKFTEINSAKYILEKKTHEQSLEIIQLNAIIKELNAKVIASSQDVTDSPLSQLRAEFNKLLQTNSLIQRQNSSQKAMNEALQAQIQSLKYQKDQFELNNTQKHQLIQRQIQQKNHLLEDIQKYTQKHQTLKQQIDKLKHTIQLNEEQTLKAKKYYQDLLDQKNNQILTLRKQIQELYKQSREFHQLRFNFDRLQKQHKQLTRKSARMGETLTHLWSVKQAEYQNINQVLGLFKEKESEDVQN